MADGPLQSTPRTLFAPHIASVTEVAELLRAADAFLDLSDDQAFGRAAGKAMACGSIALRPSLGGAPYFMGDGVMGFLADTCDAAAVHDTLSWRMRCPRRRQM